MLDHQNHQWTSGGKNQNDHADETMTEDELKKHIMKVIKEDFIDEHAIDVVH